MQPRLLAQADYTATQLGRRITLPPFKSEEIAERKDQLACPNVGITARSVIGLVGTFSNIESHIAGAFGLRLARTFSNTELFSASGITGALGLEEHKPTVKAAISQIEEFRSRKDGWKGPNSLGPTNRTIDNAKLFAAVVLADSNIEPPHIGLAADGEITFFWQNPNILIDVTIAGDDTYAYFAKPSIGKPFFEDEAPVTKNFPEKILSLIRRAA
jgi:hypothetical protein